MLSATVGDLYLGLSITVTSQSLCLYFFSAADQHAEPSAVQIKRVTVTVTNVMWLLQVAHSTSGSEGGGGFRNMFESCTKNVGVRASVHRHLECQQSSARPQHRPFALNALLSMLLIDAKAMEELAISGCNTIAEHCIALLQPASFGAERIVVIFLGGLCPKKLHDIRLSDR